jgi:hypothetical protein
VPVLNEVIKTLEHSKAPKLSTARRYTTFTAQMRSKKKRISSIILDMLILVFLPSLYAWENFTILGDVSGQVACTCDVKPGK